METEKCAALLCALETGSLSAAAERLGYTASGVSRMMAALEAETGFPLLVRGRDGVSPTAACERLLPAMRELAHQARCYTQLAASIRGAETGTIVLGTSYGLYFRWLAELIADFGRAYPGIRFHAVEGTSSELSEALAQRRADLAVISRRDGRHDWTELRRDELLVMLPAGHPLAERASVPVAALETEPFIEIYPGRETDNSRCLAARRVRPRVSFSCADTAAALALVEAGLGLTLMNAILADTLRGNVVFRPLDPPWPVRIGLATQPPESASPAAKRFLEFARRRAEAP